MLYENNSNQFIILKKPYKCIDISQYIANNVLRALSNFDVST